MKKDRFVAFFDAIMAIIMTIAVLQFAVPDGAKWGDLKELGFQIFVYALSFFWLGIMWINLHSLWNHVNYISRSVIFANIVMLFFTSMIPFWVIYIGRYFYEPIPQLLYGIDVICITISNHISLEMLAKHNPKIEAATKKFRYTIAIDMLIKVIGIIIGITVYPPAVLICSVIIALLIQIVNIIITRKKSNRKT